MKRNLIVCAALAIAASTAMANELTVSLGVRETGGNGQPVGGFGGGSSGQIEWFNLDEQVVALDDTWQQLTFDLSATGISATSFTGDGLIDEALGTIEHLRLLNSGGVTSDITIWVDKLSVTFDDFNPIIPPQTVEISTFDADPNGAPWADGTEVMFQEPGFSGSTDQNLDPAGPNASGVDNTVGFDDSSSTRADFRFVDATTSNWIRYTTFGSTLPENSPVLPLADGATYSSATLTLWIKGIPEPTSLALLALGALIARRR